MGNICFCCLDESAKVGEVFKHFTPTRVAEAGDGNLQMLVGKVTLPNGQPFFSPASCKPCVYYKIKVEEEHVTHSTDSEGRPKTNTTWQLLCTESRFTDFYLQDGAYKIFVKGSDQGHVRVQGQPTRHNNSFSQPPMGIQAMIFNSQKGWNWNKTGKYRYSEELFEVGERVAAFGIPQSAVDPYTQQPLKILNCATRECVSEERMETEQWGSSAKKSWADLFKKGPAVLMSEKQEFTAGVQIADPVDFYMPVFQQGYFQQHYGAGIQGMPMLQMQQPMVQVQQPMIQVQPVMAVQQPLLQPNDMMSQVVQMQAQNMAAVGQMQAQNMQQNQQNQQMHNQQHQQMHNQQMQMHDQQMQQAQMQQAQMMQQQPNMMQGQPGM